LWQNTYQDPKAYDICPAYGMLEFWNVGKVGRKRNGSDYKESLSAIPIIPIFQYSIIPSVSGAK
jgi:hypothetical protein